MSDEKKFEGACFESKFYVSRETMNQSISEHMTKKKVFCNVVESALNRVKHDLVEVMRLKNSDEDKWPPFVDISDEQIEKFIQHGVKITIIGEIREEVEEREVKGFEAYAKYLRELHALFAQGKDESDQGDLIREKMSDIWKKLNEDEQNKGRELSIALKTEQSTT